MNADGELRVLVADDDPSLLDLMTRRLGKMGITPDRASDGAMAQALIEQNDYDVIVTDIYMPDVTGLELLHIARERDPHVQVVVATASATIDNAVDALNNGAFAYLNKPFDHLSVFDKVVTRAMEFRRLLLDNQRMAEVQKRRGDMLEEEVTQRIRQLRDRQRDLVNLLTSLPLGVTVVEEGGRVVMRNPEAEKWLTEEKHAKRQPIREFMNSVHQVDSEPSEEVMIGGHTLRLTAVDILQGMPKKQKVVIIGEMGGEDEGISQGTMVEEAVERLCEGLTWLAGQSLERKAANVARGLVKEVVGLGRMMGLDMEDPVLPEAEPLPAVYSRSLEEPSESSLVVLEDDEEEDERFLAALQAPPTPIPASAEKPVSPRHYKAPAARETIPDPVPESRSRNGAQQPQTPVREPPVEWPVPDDDDKPEAAPEAKERSPEERPAVEDARPAPKVEKKPPAPERRLLRKAKELESGGWRPNLGVTPKSGTNGQSHDEPDAPPDESVLSRLAKVTEDTPKENRADKRDKPVDHPVGKAPSKTGVVPAEARSEWVEYEEGDTESGPLDMNPLAWPPPLPSSGEDEEEGTSTEA